MKKFDKSPAVENSGASCVYDLLVFIGRFQPLHKGHQLVIDKARKISKNVLVIVGSAGKARSTRNPFTFEERKEMLHSVYPDILVEGVSDSAYNDTKWTADVQDIVKRVGLSIVNAGGFANHGVADLRIGLIGCEKDHTSFYLKLFPQWGNESVNFVSPVNATAIRHMWFTNLNMQRYEWDVILDDKITRYMAEFDREVFNKLKADHEYILDYRMKWGEGPHLTGDSLVEVGGNILLIKRGKEYGQGLYALPGGFLNKNERFLEGALRELKEETRLKVPAPVLKGSIVQSETFDEPHRSERGRIITQAYHIKLENELKLPEVRGSDDAEWAGFKPINDLRDGTLKESDFFEDHYHIIRKMLSV